MSDEFEKALEVAFAVLGDAAGPRASVVAHVCRDGEVVTLWRDGEDAAASDRDAARVLGEVAHPLAGRSLRAEADLVNRIAGARLGPSRGAVLVVVDGLDVALTYFRGESLTGHALQLLEDIHSGLRAACQISDRRCCKGHLEGWLGAGERCQGVYQPPPPEPHIISRVKGASPGKTRPGRRRR